jgi:hypothetical protein
MRFGVAPIWGIAMRRVAVVGLLIVAMAPTAFGASSDVQVLASSPICVKDRLGQVSITLGDREPNLRTGMEPSSVSYRKAFEKLEEAARARGGEAVVLRGHEAAYFTKSARPARRPTFLLLQGAVVNLDAHGAGCALARLDPKEFERDAMSRRRENLAKDTGMDF